MKNLFEIILEDLKKGIEQAVEMCNNPSREVYRDNENGVCQTLVYAPTNDSLSRAFSMKIHDQVDPLLNMIDADTKKGRKVYDYLNDVIRGRMKKIAEHFKFRDKGVYVNREDMDYYKSRLNKLQSSVNWFYSFCYN